MAQLVVRRLEEVVVQKLRMTAAKAGISMEEQHRRILRSALGSRAKTFKEHLLAIPAGGDDAIFDRKRTKGSRRLEF